MATGMVLVVVIWFAAIRDRASEHQVREAAIAATKDRTMTCHAQDAAGAQWVCVSASGTDSCVRASVSLTGQIRVGRSESICEGP